MTTFQEAFESAQAEVDGEDTLDNLPVDDGQEGDEGEVGNESTDDTEPSYFDLETYGDQLVKIKVDGVERSVPLKELPNGYMRQEAFTQKTQALAVERERLAAAETLARAYEANPAATVRFLAEQQGITLAEAKAQAEAAGDEHEQSWANEQSADPRLDAIEAQMQEIQVERARLELDRTVANLSSKYGEDFDSNEVISRALELGTTDLESVYKQVAFDRVFARQQATKQVAEQRQAQDAKTTSAKQSLSQIVSSGSSASAGAGGTAASPITSVKAALEAAMAETGFNF